MRTHCRSQPLLAAVSPGTSRTWRAATFYRRTRWGRPCRASTIPRRMSSSSCRFFIRPVRRNRPPAEVARESFVAKGYRPVYRRPGPVRHPDHHHPRLRQADDQQHLSQVPLPVRDRRAQEPGASGHRRHQPGGRQFSPELGPQILDLHRTDRHRGQWPADPPLLDSRCQRNRVNGVRRNRGDTPRLRELSRELFPASGTLAPPPGSPDSLGPPTTVNNWNMGLGSCHVQVYPRSNIPCRGASARARSSSC